jgi:glycosyltransferase involved in cell wall biosynthesis
MDQAASAHFVYRGTGLKMLGSWFAAALRLWALAASGNISTLYLVCSRSKFGFVRDLPAYLTAVLGVRLICHVHGSDVVRMPTWRVMGPFALRALRSCELIVPSHHLEAPLRCLGVKRVHVCENFAETSGSTRTSRGKSGLIVLWNSNIMASKGFFLVASAVHQLVKDGHCLQLVATGRPIADEAMSLDQCACKLRDLLAHPWLTYHGLVDRKRAASLLADADVICLPSHYASECQPLALIEAMCAGRPIVISDIPALRATVADYPCEIVPEASEAEVAAALLRICSRNGDFSAELSAAQAARSRFSPVRFDREMLSILTSRNR